MGKILLTRNEYENQIAAAELAKLGYATCSTPMLSYTDLQYDFSKLPSHVIITSKHAARILKEGLDDVNDGSMQQSVTEAGATESKQIDVWVVGEESATILESSDNISVTAVAKDAKDLLGIISMIPEEEAQEFFKNSVYLSGNIITHELPEYIKRDIIYEVVYAQTLPKEAIESIKNSEISYIMAYSKNSAINLIKLFESYNLLPYLKHSAVIGISKEVASLFESISSRVLYSELPGFSVMIKILAHEKNNTK